MYVKKLFPLSLFITVFFANPAFGCDLCAIYTSINATQPAADTIHLGIAEQVTSYGKIQASGKHVENTEHQRMTSSITQLYGTYDLTEKLSFQATLPYINRRFKRVEGDAIDRGTEAGIGDLSVLLKYTPWELRDGESTALVQIFGGLKFATGDSDRLGEELEEGHHSEEEPGNEGTLERVRFNSRANVVKHAGHHDEEEQPSVESAIHGHDLALGSGSYDFPVGFNIFAQHDRYFASGTFHYVFRTEGDFDYRYADDLLWEFGPGYYVSLGHEHSVALKANLSGEYKGKDVLNGEKEGDTGIRSTFAGPEILFTAGNWSGELAWDIPLDINNTGVQSVADNKIRAAVSYRF